MDYKDTIPRRNRLSNWLKKKPKGPDAFALGQLSDDDEDDEDDEGEIENDSCCLPNEFRIFVGTWNVAGRSPVGSLAVDLDDWLNLKDAADLYVLGFQEIVPLKTRTVIGSEDLTSARKWNNLIGKTLNDKYKLMASKKMVGVFISVWMKNDLVKKYCISNVKVCSVACGIMGYLGNKGSVSVSMSIDGTSFCFIAAHLASGEKNGDEVRRNYQVSEIFRRTSFPRLRQDDDNIHPLTILGHDRIFWFGDLNYRLYLEDNLARILISTKDWKALQEFDQLKKEQDLGGVFEGWREGSIEFAPTYKYSFLNCNRYSGGLPAKSGEKQRTPAWCDRILWYGKGVKQLSYFRSESKFSDHRPVSALFSTQIEVLKSVKQMVITLPHIPNLNMQGGSKDEGERGKTTRPTLLSLMVQDIEPPPSSSSSSSSSSIDRVTAKVATTNPTAVGIIDYVLENTENHSFGLLV